MRATASARRGCRQRFAAFTSSPYSGDGALYDGLQQPSASANAGATTTMSFKSPLDVLKQGIARAGAGPYDRDAVLELVNGYTSGETKVVVFSWTR